MTHKGMLLIITREGYTTQFNDIDIQLSPIPPIKAVYTSLSSRCPTSLVEEDMELQFLKELESCKGIIWH